MKSENPEFISLSDINQYNSFILRNYVKYTPNQQPEGFYRVMFLGKIDNPGAGWSGYLSTGSYFLHQLQCVKNFAFALSENIATGGDFSILTVILVIIGFILGIIIRLPIGILLTLVHFALVPFISKNS